MPAQTVTILRNEEGKNLTQYLIEPFNDVYIVTFDDFFDFHQATLVPE